MRDLAAAENGRRVSVCLPARNEASTVGRIVEVIVSELMGPDGAVDEIVVVDDGSTDGTARVAADAGAMVVASADVLVECGPGQGKGDALWKSLHVASGDLIVFCDADLSSFDARFVTALVEPLVTRSDIDFVKAHYDRPLDGVVAEGGRVTELVARPLIDLFFPHLAFVRQPLGGEYAARREVLEQLPFVRGYGVDLALLIDVAGRFGTTAIAETDLVSRSHRNRPLRELGAQAREVMRTALARAGEGARVGWQSDGCDERQPMIEVPAYRAARRDRGCSDSQPTTTS